MIKHALATAWRKLRRPVYRGISPALIVLSVSVIADGVFWYFGYNSSAQNESAFIQLATAWAVAVMALASTLYLSARSEDKDSRNKQRAAYEEFLTLSDELVAARAKFDIAESARDDARRKFDAADKLASLIGDETNENASLVAYAALAKEQSALNSVEAAATDVVKAYRVAKTAAEAIVTPSVRPAFDEFSKCPPKDTPARATARSKFVQAVQSDLGVPLTSHLVAD
jgi:hypothetical protein